MAIPLTNYISEGSFGKIYSVQMNRVLKLKEITEDASGCTDWKHEFEVHKYLYSYFLNLDLKHVKIVKPIKFSFSRKQGDSLYPENVEYNSCYYTMERVHGVTTISKNLKELVKSTHIGFIAKSVIPPYLYLGAIGGRNTETRGHITLDMLNGVHLHEFFIDTLSFCEVESNSLAIGLMTEMGMAFFNCILANYMPRDIEYVFNSRGPLCSIFDFNQVTTLAERRRGREAYNLEEDIAHVYIDLCGLRKSGTKNPWFRDEPTPQWRFLCSPLTAPSAFFFIWHKIYETLSGQININKIMKYILEYTATYHLNIKNKRWKSPGPFFYHDSNIPFDLSYQEYIINTLLYNLKDVDIRLLQGLPFLKAASLLAELRVAQTYKIEENGWDVYSPF